MSRGSYLGGSTIIKTFTISGKSRTSKLKTPTQIEVKYVGTDANSQIVSAKQISKKADKNRIQGAKKIAKTKVSNQKSPKITVGEKYFRESIGAYLAIHFPKCPKNIRKIVAKRVAQSEWTGTTLNESVLSGLKAYATFDVCGYSKLVESGIPKEIAAQLIKPVVEAILKHWHLTKAVANVDSSKNCNH